MIGKTISHYKILEKLGAGGMGVVYRARDLKLDRDVALKFLPAHLSVDEKEKKRFIHEAKSVSSLDHPNICTVHEIDETGEGQLFIAMACYEGETLKEKLERGSLDIEEALDIAMQTAQGLLKAHEKGIIHRDLKPANIFITQDHIVKILDFGLAKLRGGTKLTTTGSTMGTVSYMSPEQARGEEVDERTDIWSFGVVLYEMLTGQLPFRGEYEQAVMYSILNVEPEPMAACRKEIPAVFEQICGKALVKDRTGRFQTMNEMADLLQSLKEGDARGLQEILKATLPKVRRQKVRRAVFIYGGALILLLAAAGISLSLRHREAKPAWMDPEAPKENLISERGYKIGSISPQGNYMLYIPMYHDEKYNLRPKLMNLKTGSTVVVAADEPVKAFFPVWASDGTRFACFAEKESENWTLMIGSVEEEKVRFIDIEDDAVVYCSLSWSPNGEYLAYITGHFDQNKIIIVNAIGYIEKSYSMKEGILYTTWSPDSRLLAFTQTENQAQRTGFFRFLDVSRGTFSETVTGVKIKQYGWKRGGIAWSPDGRFLVYPGLQGARVQLFAARIDTFANRIRGEPVQMTHLEVSEEPCFPSFTLDGKQMSYGIYTRNWDIYLMDFDLGSRRIFGPSTSVAMDQKWDGDPSWLSDGKGVVFLSDREGYRKMYLFNPSTGQTRKVTSTQRPESCPRPHPSGESFGFISEGRIWTVPSDGGKAVPITPDSLRLDETSRFIWLGAGQEIIYSKLESLSLTSLNRYRLGGDESKKILTTGGNALDFALSPDERILAVWGLPVPGDSLGENYFSILDLENGAKKNLMKYIRFVPEGKVSWTSDGMYILHDRPGEVNPVYELIPADSGDPVEMKIDIGTLQYRAFFINQISPSGDKVLITPMEKEDCNYFLVGKIK